MDPGDLPLTDSEWARASGYPRFWIVWYQDRFSRDDPAYIDGAFLSAEEAAASARASNQRLGPGSYELYDVTGPHALEHEPRQRPREFRQLLGLLDRCKTSG